MSNAGLLASPTCADPPYTHSNVTLSTSVVSHPTAGPSTPTTFLNVKKMTAEESDLSSRTRARFASRLVQDHTAVSCPDVDTPFVDTVELVNRLLPYHVFQQPKEDLERLTTTDKGKGKAILEDDLRKEIAETKFALECFKRKEALQTRFRNAKIRSGKRPAPDDQAYVLAQAVLDADRSETTLLNNELRSARAELERREKEKRVAATSTRAVYYGAPPLGQHTSAQSPYYRGYSYAYTQMYGAPIQPVTTPASNYAPAQTGGAIPVQLPVASLPALHALGIVPIPATSLPPEGHPQPPAVLRGSSVNGTMLSLEINVSLLQSSQMSGLALILNSLMSRSSAAASETTKN